MGVRIPLGEGAILEVGKHGHARGGMDLWGDDAAF